MTDKRFLEEYKKLNLAQKEAVDTIDGPVMVVAGPGTGKTQVLALRIANIIKKAGVQADDILCLTFTNSGVRAMRERLFSLIGPEALRVSISTFHSFGMKMIEEFYETLGFERPPQLLDDKDSVLLVDELLESHSWEHLRPRSGGAHNFKDLKSLISLLKRERISADTFLIEIEKDIDRIKNDPDSISSRGPSKGKLKKEAEERMSRLERTKETVRFFELYEQTKKERNRADYDDVLEYIVELVEVSDDARDTIRERYLYVLVDEHQDSSGVQNEFLEKVWGDTEKPNIFAVGDDRQLIYGFGGASLSHFERFRDIFPGTKLIPLVENYRSTQTILDSAGTLLESTLVKEKLSSNRTENHPIMLLEASYPRDEILAAGLAIKGLIDDGLSPNECTILVPKNAQVESAITILRDLGIAVASGDKASFFKLRETQGFISIMRVLANPFAGHTVGTLLLDTISNIPVIEAHRFLREHGYKLSIESLSGGSENIEELGTKLSKLLEFSSVNGIYALVQEIGEVFFLHSVDDHEDLLVRIEVIRTMLHLALSRMEKDPKTTLAQFVEFIDRLEEYGQDIPLAVFGADEGVKVMTLHGSKGLEFDFVWIAHMDEKSLMSQKHMGFTLPESLSERMTKKDELTARRELYVAITRAKRFCTLSYSRTGYAGQDQQTARIISELPQDLFQKRTADEVEKEILEQDPKIYITSNKILADVDALTAIKTLVQKNYAERKLAVTHLNNFFSCPWKWYFRNFLQLPEPETESLQFGNLVHHSIEHMLTGESSIKKILEQEIDTLGVFDANIQKRFLKDAEKVLQRFVDSVLPDISKERESEKSMPVYIDPDTPNIQVGGKIDLLETLPDGSVRVTDFKTGKPKSVRDIEKEDEDGRMSDYLRQLAMYSYLLLHEKAKKEVTSSRLLFLESPDGDRNVIYQTQITNEHIEKLKTDIKDYEEALKNGGWTDRPCNFKPFGNQKECPHCILATRVTI